MTNVSSQSVESKSDESTKNVWGAQGRIQEACLGSLLLRVGVSTTLVSDFRDVIRSAACHNTTQQPRAETGSLNSREREWEQR